VIQAIALVLDFAPAHWSPSTRMVAVALGDYVNTDSSYAWPSVANLARAPACRPGRCSDACARSSATAGSNANQITTGWGQPCGYGASA
jgi:hypothetical protein